MRTAAAAPFLFAIESYTLGFLASHQVPRDLHEQGYPLEPINRAYQSLACPVHVSAAGKGARRVDGRTMGGCPRGVLTQPALILTAWIGQSKGGPPQAGLGLEGARHGLGCLLLPRAIDDGLRGWMLGRFGRVVPWRVRQTVGRPSRWRGPSNLGPPRCSPVRLSFFVFPE